MHWDVGQGKSWIFFLNTGLPFPPKAVSLGRTRGTARKSPRATLVASRTKWWLTKPQKTWRTLEQLTEAQSLKRHVLLCGMAAKKNLVSLRVTDSLWRLSPVHDTHNARSSASLDLHCVLAACSGGRHWRWLVTHTLTHTEKHTLSAAWHTLERFTCSRQVSVGAYLTTSARVYRRASLTEQPPSIMENRTRA